MRKKYEKSEFALVRLRKGDDLPDTLLKELREMEVTSAAILFGVGMLEESVIGYWDGERGEYLKETIKEPAELVHLSGTLAEGESIHLHVALARRDHKLSGGHLFSAKVAVVAEIGVVVLPKGTLKREMDEDVGLNLLVL